LCLFDLSDVANKFLQIVVGQERKSIDNWINHIIGASRLLDSRGREDVSNTSSPEMFYSWRSAIVSSVSLIS
jgi:hypothetical protein